LLVLSRKHNQKIALQIGTEVIELTIVRIDHNKVRIGIQAPESVTVLRSELLEKKKTTEEVG
jgi:carbon storage regulator CsrA